MRDGHDSLKKLGGAKFLLLELFITTLGLLIALSLNNFVESRHHRNMVHQADAAMHAEIEKNATTVAGIQQQIVETTSALDKDLVALADLRAHPEQASTHLSFDFTIRGFDDTAWKTTQTAGTFVYMPYEDASEFSGIYSAQEEVYKVQQQAIVDVLTAASSMVTKPDGVNLTPAEVDKTIDRIGTAKMRLVYLKNLVGGLNDAYRQYQARHP